MTPARITEPAVGASVWASGSQVWTREQRHLHRERDGEGQEQPASGRGGDRVLVLGDRDQVEGEVGAGPAGVQHRSGDEADQHEGRAEHRVEEELHGGVAPVRVAPARDEEVHRDQHDLEHHEEEEEVEREEHAEAPGLEQQEPGEERLLVVVRRRAEDGDREQHAGHHDQEQRDPVDAEVPGDVEVLDPGGLLDHLEAGDRPSRTRRGSPTVRAPVATANSVATSRADSARRRDTSAVTSAPTAGSTTMAVRSGKSGDGASAASITARCSGTVRTATSTIAPKATPSA